MHGSDRESEPEKRLRASLWLVRPFRQERNDYMVLGYLIEKISGQTYEAFVQENIFKPLAMNDSGMFSNDAVISRRATGYWPGDNGIENADRPDWRIGFSAGSLYSTTQDLL